MITDLSDFMDKFDLCREAARNRFGVQDPAFSFDDHSFLRFADMMRQNGAIIVMPPTNDVLKLSFGGRARTVPVYFKLFDCPIIRLPEVPGENVIPWLGFGPKKAVMFEKTKLVHPEEAVSDKCLEIADLSDAVIWAIDSPSVMTYGGLAHKEDHNESPNRRLERHP